MYPTRTSRPPWVCQVVVCGCEGLLRQPAGNVACRVATARRAATPATVAATACRRSDCVSGRAAPSWATSCRSRNPVSVPRPANSSWRRTRTSRLRLVVTP
ncbi:Uncharacterised protein [Mycobacteroides abscessus subsp. abscessus]|nr:Uncharacterised protein [Mycobacteroides abscessus subsp. abscessus]